MTEGTCGYVAHRSKPGKRDDGHKVALVIEGGGMRGSVSAGMVSAAMDLGFGGALPVNTRARHRPLPPSTPFFNVVHPVVIVLQALTRALSLPDAFDGVFGSSAGSLVGAYFVGAQVRLQQTTPDTLRAVRSAEFCSYRQEGMPQYGCSLYYDLLTDGLVRPA